jgi:hypothetical protein
MSNRAPTRGDRRTNRELAGLPSFDNPVQYRFIHESIREHRRAHVIVKCFECMKLPRDPHSEAGQRCTSCDVRRKKRMRIAASAKGDFDE